MSNVLEERRNDTPEDTGVCNGCGKAKGGAADLTDVPKVEPYHDDKILIRGVPFVGGECGVMELLHWYKRLMTTGKMGRSKEEHADLMSEATRQYNQIHAKQLWRTEKVRRIALTSYLTCDDADEKAMRREMMNKLPIAPKKVLVLPDDVSFTLPITYEVEMSETADEVSLLVRLWPNTAAYATERLSNGELRALSTDEVECWLRIFRDMLIYDIQAMFEDIKRTADNQKVPPDYSGHSNFTKRLQSFSSTVGKSQQVS